MRILYVGPDYRGSNGTCWRDAFVELGHEVSTFDDERPLLPKAALSARLLRKWRGRPAAEAIEQVNFDLQERIRSFQPHMTMYVKGAYALPETLELSRSYGPNMAYMNDDMFNPQCRSYLFFELIKRLDCILTTKSYNVREFEAAGAHAIYVANSFDPKIHYPVQPRANERAKFAGDVAFIGTFWPERADFMVRLNERPGEFRLNLWGTGWEKAWRIDNWHRMWRWGAVKGMIRGRELWCEEMSKAINANSVILGLLCHANRDLHTSRSFEIPACGGFMLAERTEEHRLYFEEDREAVYFSCERELLDKVRYYTARDTLRQSIAQTGYERVLRSAATYTDRARFAIEQYKRLRPRGTGGVDLGAPEMAAAQTGSDRHAAR